MSTTEPYANKLELDEFGRAILTDLELAALESSMSAITAGTNSSICGGSTNGSCTNSLDCANTINNRCINSSFCGGSKDLQTCPGSVSEPGPGNP